MAYSGKSVRKCPRDLSLPAGCSEQMNCRCQTWRLRLKTRNVPDARLSRVVKSKIFIHAKCSPTRQTGLVRS
ncbi:hypothetical protein B0H19DRAFT_1122421, partial [Mycena capillaripes]